MNIINSYRTGIKVYLRFVSYWFILGLLTIGSINAMGCESAYRKAISFLNPELQNDKVSVLYIVDGKVMDSREVDKLDQAEIEKMEFIQDQEKIKDYTDEEVDMVVLITMKKENTDIETEDED